MNTWKNFVANEVTHSVAHYLTTLRHLQGRRGYARVADIAKELDIAKGSVSVQMKHLKEKGFVLEDENRFLKLTPSGEAIARKILYNRKVLIRFLDMVLGVAPERAEIDACKIEHLLSKETCHQLLSLVQFLQSDDAIARKFRERFRKHKVTCPSIENCNLCTVECLAREDQEVSREDSIEACPRKARG